MSSQFDLSVGAHEAAVPRTTSRLSIGSLGRVLLFGSATLGLAVGLERLLGFLASVLAARVAGPQTFGAYSMVLATAGTIAAYAGAGIGTTATRFSGQYRPDTDGYHRFIFALAVVSLSSAALAALLMFAGATPLARGVLNNEGLVSVLRIAAIASAAMVLLECGRGLLIGQQKYYALLALSVVSGLGLVLTLPLAARFNAGMMIAAQASVSLAGILLFLVLAKRFGLSPNRSERSASGPGIRPVLAFGLVQFGAFAGVSIASWWIASLVARSDVTLTQMGLYAIANQFRGLATMAPGLCEHVGYPLLTNESGTQFGGPSQVLMTNSFVGSALATLIAGAAIVFAPWLLAIVYGSSFAGAELSVVILLATGIIHMSGGPATQRLSIVRLRLVGIINTTWAISLAALGIWLVPQTGANGAALAFLMSHILSFAMVIVALARIEKLSASYLQLFAVSTIGSLLLAGLGYWRALEPGRLSLTVGLAALVFIMLAALFLIGARARCLPAWKSLRLGKRGTN